MRLNVQFTLIKLLVCDTLDVSAHKCLRESKVSTFCYLRVVVRKSNLPRSLDGCCVEGFRTHQLDQSMLEQLVALLAPDLMYRKRSFL